MVRFRLLSLCLLLLVAGCSDSLGPRPTIPAPTADIVDAMHNDGNAHFFWLPPMVKQPPSDYFGVLESLASPRVIVVCEATNDPAVATCDGVTPVSAGAQDAVFTRSAGLVVETDHFKVEFDTKAFDLSVSGGSVYTTYRIIAQTDPLTELGGPFDLGWADFQVGANGQAAKSLSNPDEMIGLVDGRVLPIRFRIDQGAYALALQTAEDPPTAPDYPADDDPLCEINCSVTIIPTNATTTATLSDPFAPELGPVTAMQFLPGDVANTSILIIDERTTREDDDVEEENCAPGVDNALDQSVRKKHCFRYVIFPDVAFENDVRWGICPRDLTNNEDFPELWRLLKADYAGGEFAGFEDITEVDVSDFLPCPEPEEEVSLLGSVVRYAANWLAPPLSALGSTPTWGGTAKDLSDMFWSPDVEVDLPDLIVSSAEVDPEVFFTTSPEPRVVSVSYTLANQGAEGPAGNSTFDVALYFSVDEVLDTNTDIELTDGYSAWTEHLGLEWTGSRTEEVTLPEGLEIGLYFIFVVVDAKPGQPPNNYPGVVEADETNNEESAQILVSEPIG